MRPARRFTRREGAALQRAAAPRAARREAERGPARPVPRVRLSRRHLFAVLVLGALVFASYLPALSAGFVWDDAVFAEEPVLREGLSGLQKIWLSPRAIANEGHYWPVVYTSFWLEHRLWGLEPFGCHLVNLLLHLASTALVWRLLQELRVPGSFAAAAVFAVHPLHVESVAWVIERKDLLSGVFFLGALLAWLRFIDRPGAVRYLKSLGLFVAALLSKSIAVTLPATLLIERFWRTGRIGRADLLRTAPFFVVAASITAADLAFYRTREALLLDHSLAERVLIAARALWFYAGKLVWPGELPVIYPLWEIRVADPLAWSWVAGAVGVAALAWLGHRRFGRAPLAALAFFAVTLSPVLGFVDYGYMQFAFVADRFQYLAGVGIIGLVAGFAVTGAARLPGRWRRTAAAALCGVLIFFGALSFRQSRIYENEVTFFGHIVTLNPAARDAHLNLANALIEHDRHDEAVTAARRAVETSANPASAYSNLGLALLHLERFEEAETQLRHARDLDPEHRIAAQNLAELLRRQGQYERAAETYREVLAIDSSYSRAYAGLGESLHHLGRHEEAANALRRSLTLTPDATVARTLRTLLADALRQLEQLDEAAAEYERLIEEDAADPNLLSGLANVRAAQGRREEADRLIGRVLESGDKNAAALQNIAEALRKRERYEEAVDAYRQVSALDPSFGSAHAGRASALFELGRYQESIDAMERALALEPVAAVQPAREVLIARSLDELGRPAGEVAARYRKALEVDPRHSDALDRLGLLRFGQGRYREALDLYRTRLEVAPDNSQLHSNIGASLVYLGRLDEAYRSFERAVALDPGNQVALRNLEAIRAVRRQEPGR